MPMHRPRLSLWMPITCLVLAFTGLALGSSYVAPLFWITGGLCLLTLFTKSDQAESTEEGTEEGKITGSRLRDQAVAQAMAEELADWMKRIENHREELSRCIDPSFLNLTAPLRRELLTDAGKVDASAGMEGADRRGDDDEHLKAA